MLGHFALILSHHEIRYCKGILYPLLLLRSRKNSVYGSLILFAFPVLLVKSDPRQLLALVDGLCGLGRDPVVWLRFTPLRRQATGLCRCLFCTRPRRRQNRTGPNPLRQGLRLLTAPLFAHAGEPHRGRIACFTTERKRA